MSNELERYQKLSITLKSYLKGKGYHKALEAFEFAKERHPGFRKDGKTPNFQHQIEICLFLITLKEIEFEEETIIAGLLHDVREDADVEHIVIKKLFGKRVADAVEKLTKEFNGIKKDTQEYFNQIALCPIASLVKLADRIHNVSSMVGVFTIPKQDHYVFEIKEYFFPLIKKARNNFPQQHMSYHAMGTFLKNMCKTVEAVLFAEKELIKVKELLSNTDNATPSIHKSSI
jgi:(p)ppGpp synthase/HD superfamily hydrolase